MKGSVIPKYSGLPTELKKLGYRNLFFMTHESQYDNMNGFFRTNGFDDVSLARMSNPPMTTVHQDIQMKGRLAVQYIMESIDGDNAKKENILPISIVERESVKWL